MGEEVTAELDVLDLLEANVERLIAGLKEAGADTAYLEGQLSYLTALYDRLGDVPKDVRPRELLDDVAREEGIELVDGELDPAPEGQHGAGVVSMWSLCLGFVEGAAKGVQAAMDAIGHQEGLSAVAHEE